MLRTSPLLLALCLALLGCSESSEGESSTGAPAAAPTPAPTPPAPAAPAGPRASSDTFELVAAAESAGYQAGELGQFAIELSPKAPWHVNVEYPIRVTLQGPSEVGLVKQELAAEDAAELEEARARFDVPFTPAAAGDHQVEAVVSFGLCREESCIFEDRTLALALPVH